MSPPRIYMRRTLTKVDGVRRNEILRRAAMLVKQKVVRTYWTPAKVELASEDNDSGKDNGRDFHGSTVRKEVRTCIAS
jgi:hypothetical protein